MDYPIDIDALSQPISTHTPCGEELREDVRFDSPYQVLKNLRDEAVELERGDRSPLGGGGQDSGQLTSKWREVVDQSADILGEQSKDIEVCALLVEGLVRTSGLEGLAAGLRLTSTLVATYWNELHPRLDPDDPDSLEDRVAAFNGLDGAGQPGTLARYIPRLPITLGAEHDYLSYQLEQAFTAESNARGNEEGSNTSRLSFTLADIERAAQKTPVDFYRSAIAALEECERNLSELDTLFTERCGFNAPSTSMIRGAFDKLGGNLRFLAGGRIAAAEAQEAAPASQENPAPATGAAAIQGEQATPGGLQSRADAINQLRTVARFFRETEPHSPLSYSLENIVRWAGMPLDQLIEEWISDDAARERYRLMTGMRPRSGQDGNG